MTRLRLLLPLLVLVTLVAPPPAGAQASPAEVFVAPLAGAAEVPPVDIGGSGVAALALRDDGSVDYTLHVRGLSDVTQAHIHLGAAGVNGPVVAPLFGPVEAGVTRDGVLVRARIDGDDLVAADGFDATPASLLAELRAGRAYVNVHTLDNPAGEVRGQVAALAVNDRFGDDDGPHEAAIDVLAAAGVAVGARDRSYEPARDLSREEMAAFLVRGLALPVIGDDAFADDDGSPYEAEINALAASGITEGCDSDAFCPTDPVSRAELASFLVRALALTGGEDAVIFDDTAESSHRESINVLAAAGIARGATASTYEPQRAVRRDETASFLARAVGWTPTSPPATGSLTLLHNNDGESALLGSDDIGGAARFKTVVDQLKAEAQAQTGGALMLSSGDNFLAGPVFAASVANDTYYDALALQAIGYDALALGNHDFDFGPSVLAEFIEQFDDPPPFLSANLDVDGTPLEGLAENGTITPGTLLEVGALRIGVVGAITPGLRSISSPGEVEVLPDVAERIQATVNGLGDADAVVLISHLQSINEELSLIPQLSGVDIVVAGGGDELLADVGAPLLPGDEENVFGPYPLDAVNADGYEVPVVTTPGQYSYVGRLVAGLDPAGRVTAVDDVSGLVPVRGQAPDPALVSAVVEPVQAYVAELDANQIATAEVALEGSREAVRTVETNLGNLVADAFLWQAEQEGLAPDVALQNGGGIRNDALLAAGPLTELDTFEILPFSNFLSVVDDVERTVFKEILENAVSNVENVDGRFAQVGGFSFTWDPAGAPRRIGPDGGVTQPGTRVRTVTLDDGTPIVVDGEVVDGDPLTVASIDFSINGGDDYPFGEDVEFTRTTVSYQQALANYLVAPDGLAGTVGAGQYPEGGEGRIVRQ